MTTGVIPPDGVCLWEHCGSWRAHDGTHFCAVHQSHASEEDA